MKKSIAYLLSFIGLTCLIFGCTTKVEKIEKLISKAQDENTLHGCLLILEKDEMLYEGENGFSDYEKNTLNNSDQKFYLASLSKLFTQLAILKLTESDILSLDDSLVNFFSTIDTSIGRITVVQLMNMTSGLPREINGNSETSFVEFDDSGMSLSFLDSILLANNLNLIHKPGESVSYSNLGYWLLGSIIEKKTRLNCHKAFDKLIFQPNGMEQSGLKLPADGKEDIAIGYVKKGKEILQAEKVDFAGRYTSGGCFSSLADLNKLANSILKGNYLNDESKRLLFNLTEDAKEPEVVHNDQFLEMYGNLPGFTNFLIIDERNQLAIFSLNNISVPDLAAITELKTDLLRILKIKQDRKGSNKVVTVTNMNQYPKNEKLAIALSDWIEAIEIGNKNLIWEIVRDNSVEGEFKENDESWEILSRSKSLMGQFKVAGFQRVGKDSTGIRIWIVGEGEAKLCLGWLPPESDTTKLETLEIIPIDFKFD